jgi:hypothetical protein
MSDLFQSLENLEKLNKKHPNGQAYILHCKARNVEQGNDIRRVPGQALGEGSPGP